MTKVEFCEMMISRMLKNNKLKSIIDVNDVHIKMNPSAAICMVYLGLIKNPEWIRLTSAKSGLVDGFYDEIADKRYVLTVRDLLNILPD